MIERIKNKGLGFWIEIGASVLALVTGIMGMTQHALTTNTNFTPAMDIILFIGVAASIAALFVDFDFWALIPAVCFSIVFGLTVYGGAAVIADYFNHVVYSGGNLSSVVSYLVMLFVASAVSIVACFLKPNKD